MTDRKVEEMEAAAGKIQGEITVLQSERAALLAKLEKIELALTKAQAAKVQTSDLSTRVPLRALTLQLLGHLKGLAHG